MHFVPCPRANGPSRRIHRRWIAGARTISAQLVVNRYLASLYPFTVLVGAGVAPPLLFSDAGDASGTAENAGRIKDGRHGQLPDMGGGPGRWGVSGGGHDPETGPLPILLARSVRRWRRPAAPRPSRRTSRGAAALLLARVPKQKDVTHCAGPARGHQAVQVDSLRFMMRMPKRLFLNGSDPNSATDRYLLFTHFMIAAP